MIFERGYFNSFKRADSRQTLNESVVRTRTFSSRSIKSASDTTVFISHKHEELDLGELDGVLEMLGSYNIIPYIDSMDVNMPNETCAETAARLKQVIQYCDKFILLATNKAIESYWCNWEVGIGDVHKYKNNIAILTIKDKGQYDINYKGNEFLQLYSSIEYFNGTSSYRNGQPISAGYYVRTPKSELYNILPLHEWLNQQYL